MTWGTSWLLEKINDTNRQSDPGRAAEINAHKGWKNNKVPTHDPYTNPNAMIYFECGCGQTLDPGTKSFAALTTFAGRMGWKIRFGVEHYIAYCVGCGKDIE